jgi:DNA sulfur modification protein DndB
MIHIPGILGISGRRKVFLGFATGKLLSSISFADILNEETGEGYQRRFSTQHSIDFRKYIQSKDSSTIPLTFNLRCSKTNDWDLIEGNNSNAILGIKNADCKVLARVDCQHRLGFLNDIEISLPFMAFLELSLVDEMKVFSVINSKAKGLSSSLLDYHDAQLATNLAIERPELYIALFLNDYKKSPWFKQLDLGGKKTIGMMRRASLRTLQKSIKRFLINTNLIDSHSVSDIGEIIMDFWMAIVELLNKYWENPRKSIITKGIGVYALMAIAGILVHELQNENMPLTKEVFICKLSDFVHEINWSNDGTFRGLGGESGVQEAVTIIKNIRSKVKTLQNG